MSSTTTSKVGAKIIAIAVLIPFCVVAWIAAPFLLPVWRWQNLEWGNGWAELAKKTQIPEAQLRTEYDMIIRFAQRSDKDPYPWQLVTSTPSWQSVDPEKNLDEEKLLVRVAIISDRDGTPPSQLWVGANEDQKYLHIKAWRFPAGTFGLGKGKRPVILYQGGSLTQVPITEAQQFKSECPSWETDDHMEGRDDGFGAPAE